MAYGVEKGCMGQGISLHTMSVIQQQKKYSAVASGNAKTRQCKEILILFFLMKTAFISVHVHMEYSPASEQIMVCWEAAVISHSLISLSDASDELIYFIEVFDKK